MLVRALESSYTQGRRTQYGGRSLRNGSPRVRLSRVVLHRGGHAWNRGRPGGRVRGSFLPCADEVGLGGAATFVAAASRGHRTHELTGREVTRRNIVAVAKPGSMGTGTKRWAFAPASRLRCGATSRPTSRRSRQRPLRRSRSCEGETSLDDIQFETDDVRPHVHLQHQPEAMRLAVAPARVNDARAYRVGSGPLSRCVDSRA